MRMLFIFKNNKELSTKKERTKKLPAVAASTANQMAIVYKLKR
jgi:hypothetical protein